MRRRCRRRGPSVVPSVVVGDDNDGDDAKPRHDVDAWILIIAVAVRPFPRSNAALGRNMTIRQLLSPTFGVLSVAGGRGFVCAGACKR